MCCANCKCRIPRIIMGLLLVVGGLNWGLVGLGGFLDQNLNLVNFIFGKLPVAENVTYLVVGVAALAFALHGLFCKCCKGEGKEECCKGEGNGDCCKK